MRGLVATDRDGAQPLELCEEILDQMAFLVSLPIVAGWLAPIGFERDYRALVCGGEWGADPCAGGEPLVGDERIDPHAGRHVVRADQIRSLPPGEMEANWIAKRIGEGVDLGA